MSSTIHDLLNTVDAALVHFARGPTGYGPITTTLALLTGTLHSHFAYEESQRIAPLARAESIYLREVDPLRRADIVIDNAVFASSRLVPSRYPGARGVAR